jgi:hypothetical protein
MMMMDDGEYLARKNFWVLETRKGKTVRYTAPDCTPAHRYLETWTCMAYRERKYPSLYSIYSRSKMRRFLERLRAFLAFVWENCAPMDFPDK